MGSRSRQRPPAQQDHMAEADRRIRALMDQLLARLQAEYDRMVCPKCGRGIMKPTFVAPAMPGKIPARGESTMLCHPSHPVTEHLHEECTMCGYTRWLDPQDRPDAR